MFLDAEHLYNRPLSVTSSVAWFREINFLSNGNMLYNVLSQIFRMLLFQTINFRASKKRRPSTFIIDISYSQGHIGV